MKEKEIMEICREIKSMDGLTDKSMDVLVNTEYQLIPELYGNMTAAEINKMIEETF